MPALARYKTAAELMDAFRGPPYVPPTVEQQWVTVAKNYERQAAYHWRRASEGGRWVQVDERLARQYDEKADDAYRHAYEKPRRRAVNMRGSDA